MDEDRREIRIVSLFIRRFFNGAVFLMIPELQTLLRLTKGYRLRPWQSPYLRWRIETWSGQDAKAITPRMFFDFSWEHRSDLFRYLRWAGKKGG